MRFPRGVGREDVLDVAVVLRLRHAQVAKQELEPAIDRDAADTEGQRDLGHRLELPPADGVGTRGHVQQRHGHGARDVAVQVHVGGGRAGLLDHLHQAEVVGGVGAVLGFIPQMLVLFILLAFLESCGYMSRIGKYQGSLVNKGVVQKRFESKNTDNIGSWDDLRYLWDFIINNLSNL